MEKKVINALDYDEIYYFEEFIEVRKGNLCGLFKTDGTLVLPVEFNDLSIERDYIEVRKGECFGAFSKDGTPIIPVEFNQLNFENGCFVGIETLKNDHCGVFKKDGTPILPVEFDDVEVFKEGYIYASKGCEQHLYLMDGSIALPFEFLKIDRDSDDGTWYLELSSLEELIKACRHEHE